MVRQKNRYLLCQFLYPSNLASQGPGNESIIPDIIAFHRPTSDALTAQLLTRAIRADVAALFGDYGAGVIAASLNIKYLSPATSTFIVRVARAQHRLVWAALSFMTCVPVEGTPCVVRVLRVSGTIRKAEEEAIRRARLLVVRVKKGEEGLDGRGIVDSGLGEVEMNDLEDEDEEDLGEVVEMDDVEDADEEDGDEDEDEDQENDGTEE